MDADVHERDVVGEGVVGVAEGDGLEGEGEVGGDGALDLGRRGGRLEAHDVAEVLGEDDEGDDDVGGVIRGELLHRGVGVVRGVRLRARALGGGGGRGVADVRISLGEGEVVGGDVVVREAPVEVVLGEAVLRLEGGRVRVRVRERRRRGRVLGGHRADRPRGVSQMWMAGRQEIS